MRVPLRVVLLAGSILLCALALRLAGVPFGFPLLTHPDEHYVVDAAHGMVERGDLDPRFLKYPSLYIYTQAALQASLARFHDPSPPLKRQLLAGPVDEGLLRDYFWGRCLTVLLSIASIMLAGDAARRLWGSSAALLTVLMLSVARLQVENSFSVTVDTPAALGVALTLWLSVRIVLDSSPSLLLFALGGISAGLAIGTKYTSLFCIVPLFIAYLWRCEHDKSDPRRDRRGLLMICLVPASFLLSTPYALLHLSDFLLALGAESAHYRGEDAVGTQNLSYGYYTEVLIEKFGTVPLLLSILGAVLLALKSPRSALLVFSFPILHTLFIGSFKVHFARNALPALPFLAMAASYATVRATAGLGQGHFTRFWNLKGWTSKGQRSRAMLSVLVVFALGVDLCGQAWSSWNQVKQVRLPNTRLVALEWFEENVPEGSRVGREFYAPPIDRQRYEVQELGLSGIARQPLFGLDVIVSSSVDYDRYLNNPDLYPAWAACYHRVFAEFDQLAVFSPQPGESSGPTIRIFSVPSDSSLSECETG